jgi:hypothetical protein
MAEREVVELTIARFTHFAEIHRLHTFASQCRTDGRRRRRLAGADDQFDDLIALYYSFCHDECGGCALKE